MRFLRPPVNRYFVRVCTDTARQVDSSGPELPVRLPRVATGRFQVAPISPDDLCRVVGRMRNSAACGSDGLCIRFIKICLPSLCHVITHIVNSSLASHHVPDSWKLTFVHPIQKSPKSTDTANYRPISILSTIAKIIERIVYEQLFTTSPPITCSRQISMVLEQGFPIWGNSPKGGISELLVGNGRLLESSALNTNTYNTHVTMN